MQVYPEMFWETDTMQRLTHNAPLSWTLAAGLLLFCGLKVNPALGQETQEITVRFDARVGDQEFACGESYSGLGAEDTEVMATDFRFYVSDVSLINAAGEVVPLELEQDGKWQYETVALLDFEDRSGPCANGTPETRDQVVGTLPAGDYQGLQFTLGVPFALNHDDATLAPSPLNLTSMWWNWQGGYKFVRIDLEPTMTMMSMEGAEAEEAGADHGAHGGSHGEHGGSHSEASGFLIHLGSTGCQVPAGEQQPTECSNPNRTQIIFEDFDPEQDVVVADLTALVSNSDLTSNQPETAPGCMSGVEDQDCDGIFGNLGLGEADQSFFRAE